MASKKIQVRRMEETGLTHKTWGEIESTPSKYSAQLQVIIDLSCLEQINHDFLEVYAWSTYLFA
jgi:hypothetical protein